MSTDQLTRPDSRRRARTSPDGGAEAAARSAATGGGVKRLVARLEPWLFALPAIAVCTLVVTVPIVWSLTLSLFQWDGVSPMRFIGMDNYFRLLSDDVLRTAFLNNLVFTFVGTLVQFVVGMALALLLLSLKRFRNLFKVAYFIPCIISSVAISLVFERLLSANPEGVVNAVFRTLGLTDLQGAYLSDPNLTLIIVTLVDAYKFWGIYMVIYYAAFMAVDREVLEAASLDGANWWQQYVYLKFPLIKGIVLVTIVMLVSGTLKAFDVPFILTNGGPGAASELVATHMYKTIFTSSDFGYGSAVAMFLVVECLLIVAIIRRVFRSEEGE